ncbi:pilus assembly protein TadG-related protein [Micromonospora sp. IBHARD004]|uniref:pilus assembly protein TadG-related protein n=1 Tax=Micromonospora sp. IBHARD004 TaxID=3457764 RepID=UPI004057FAA8
MSVIRRLRARFAGARGDRGAVATTVALLLGSGVLLGMAALVVDVGNLYAERGQLQNGADAGAVKVGQICATDPADCSPDETDFDDVVDRYADRNANDGAAAATVCGRGGELPACALWENRLTDCVGPPPVGVSYVEVHTSTRGDDDSTVLPPVFAQAVVGGYEGAQVGACSRVAWGPPARATTLALAVSICDWNRNTTDTTDGRQYDEEEAVLPVYDETAPKACGVAGTSAENLGGYRWLEDADRECRATASIAEADGYPVSTGDSRPPGRADDCDAALASLRTSKQPVLVPVFDQVTGRGGTARYHVSGFAAFVVTGWHLPTSKVPSRVTGQDSCADEEKSCVFGYFTQTLVPGGGAIGGPDLGARVVAPIG